LFQQKRDEGVASTPFGSFSTEPDAFWPFDGIANAPKSWVHATFMQKVIICAVAGFLAASLVEWGKVFVEGADDALNKGYKHRSVIELNGKP
jgi:hypothetical protein